MGTEIVKPGDFSITKPSFYTVTMVGVDACLMNRKEVMNEQKKKKEKDKAKIDHAAMEEQMWRDRLYTVDGKVMVPGENAHEMLKSAAKYWGAKIPGEGNKTYTDVIAKSCILEYVDFGISNEDPSIIPFQKWVNGNPSKGGKGGSAVLRIRPMIRPWRATCVMHVFDGRVTDDVVNTLWAFAGTYIGFGDWRPVYGRFNVTSIIKG